MESPSNRGDENFVELRPKARVHRTKTALVVEALREAISNGDIVPGQRFDIRKLAAQLETSITPVREALRILQADGLVSYDEHRAISAVDLSAEDANEVYALRSLIEAFATERAAERCTQEDREAIRQAHTDMLSAVTENNDRQVRAANRAWHFAIYQASRSRFTVMFIERLWSTFDWNSIWQLPGRLDQSVIEHGLITDAILSGNGAEAGALMSRHVGGGERAVHDYQRLSQPANVPPPRDATPAGEDAK